MPRRLALLALGLAGWSAFAPWAGATAQGSSRVAEARRFFKGLHDRGFHDLAPLYAERIRAEASPPAELLTLLELEDGLGLVEQARTATKTAPQRLALLDSARTRIEAFVKAHEGQAIGDEAQLALARLFVDRGQLATHQAEEAEDGIAAKARQTEARAAFELARATYGKALGTLKAAYDKLPKTYLSEDDPRKSRREEVQLGLQSATFERANVEYLDAQTFVVDATDKADRERNEKERVRRLDRSIELLQDLYEQHREQITGLYARRLQGKCLEEKGNLSKAMGIYNELMDQPDPRLKPLQREVAYYQVIVANKRQEYGVAVDKANAWLKANEKDDSLLATRLGVQLERSKAILAQKPNIGRDQERDAIDSLNQVLNYASPFKREALALLAQNRPKTDKAPVIPPNITYDNARKEADQASKVQDWGRSIAYLKAAIRVADPARDPDKANDARVPLVYAYFQDQRYYEAAVLGEHIARRYPKYERAAQAAEFALSAWFFAYTNLTEGDRTGDLNRMLDLSKYVIATFPNTEQEQAARLTIGSIALSQGRYADAAESLEGIPAGSARWLEARTQAAQAHWRLGLKLLDDGKKAEADGQIQKAIALYKETLQARKDANAAASDPGLLGNATDLAELYLATEAPAEALALLAPIVKGATAETNAEANTLPITRLLSVQLRSHIAAGQTDAAIEDMRVLEKVGGEGTPLTQLYLNLGRLLEKELDGLKAKGDQAKFQQTELAYTKFLEALAGSKSGQTYESLQWAGEALLSLGQSDRAGEVFQRVLDTYSKDTAFQGTPNASARLLRTRLKLVTAGRSKADKESFEKALAEVEVLVKDHPNALDPLLERCRVLEDWADFEATGRRWDAAINYWKQLATLLTRGKRPEQFEAWYHVADCQRKKGAKQDAVRTLKGILALNPKLNGADMQAKYQELLKQLGQP